MSVSRRVVLGVAGLMVLALATLGYQLWVVMQMQNVNEELSKVNFVAASQLLRMEEEAEEIESQSRKYFAIADSGMRALVDEGLQVRMDSFDQRLTELQATLESWEAPDEVALLAQAWTDF